MTNTEPMYPAGTPEYETYASQLRAELTKFATGQDPYPYECGGCGRLNPPENCAINCGKRLDDAAEKIPDTLPASLANYPPLDVWEPHALLTDFAAEIEMGTARGDAEWSPAAKALAAEIERRMDAAPRR